MAWARLALLQAAGENDDVLQQTALLFGFKAKQQPVIPPEENPEPKDRGTQQTLETPKKQQRPPAVFLRVNSRQTLDNQDDNKPDYFNDKTLHLEAKSGSYRFDPPTALMPMSHLLPFLFNSLSQTRPSQKLNQRRLISSLAQGKALHCLPYTNRPCWPRQMQIIVDASLPLESYWADFAFIIGRLQKLLGKEAVTALRFDENSLGTEPCFCIPWPTQNQHQWQRWQAPPQHVAILILSDLGLTDANPATRSHWQRFIERLETHTAPILTLSPVARSPEQQPLCNIARPNPLNDRYKLPRHPKRNGFKLPEAALDQLEEILALLSPLPVVDVGLLRRLRLELNWGGSELESQLWNHPECRQTGLGLCLHESSAEKYRQHYRQHLKGTQQARDLWKIVEAHHKPAFEGLKQLEAFNCWAMEGIEKPGVRNYFKALCVTVDDNNQPAQQARLLLQCSTLLAFIPQDIWQSDLAELAYGVYAMAHADDIRKGNWPDTLQTGFDPDRLQWLVDKNFRGERVRWQILQTGDQGQFICRRLDAVAGTAQESLVEGSVIATLDAEVQFPPRLQFLASDDSTQTVLHGSQAFELPTGVVTLQSNFQRLELETLSKPSWASAIWRNSQGLCARIVWLGQSMDVPWQTGDGIRKGHWQWQSPFAEDGLGLYADLAVNRIVQRFRWIAPGTFDMGSPKEEPGRYDDEVQHQVTLTKGYWLADTACTQALWRAVMGENPAYFTDSADNPVEQVNFDEVQQFIAKLNGLFPSLNARLPTEAEWEYACRAGTSTPFSFGVNITPEQVNYDGSSPYNNGEGGLERGKTVAVKSLPANAWGLYEMHGNVWEWCQDWWVQDLSKEPVTDPTGSATGAYRVLRGGSWYNDGWDVRSAYRDGYTPDYRNDNIGFRLALGHELRLAGTGREAASGGDAGRPVAEQGQPVAASEAEPKTGFWAMLKNTVKPNKNKR